MTPLHCVSLDDLDMIALLLKHGAYPNVKSRNGKTLLMDALEYSPPTSLSATQNAKISSPFSDVPVYTSTYMKVFGTDKTLGGSGPNYQQRIALLLKYGADVNAADADGWTPLMRASFWGDLSMAKAFLAHGARKEARDKTGHTALDYAKAARRTALISLLAPH